MFIKISLKSSGGR